MHYVLHDLHLTFLHICVVSYSLSDFVWLASFLHKRLRIITKVISVCVCVYTRMNAFVTVIFRCLSLLMLSYWRNNFKRIFIETPLSCSCSVGLWHNNKQWKWHWRVLAIVCWCSASWFLVVVFFFLSITKYFPNFSIWIRIYCISAMQRYEWWDRLFGVKYHALVNTLISWQISKSNVVSHQTDQENLDISPLLIERPFIWNS